jgi:hypothetical protein
MVLTKQHEMRVLICCVYMVLIALFTCGSLAAEEYVLSKGQTVYVPVYSNIYSSAKKVPIHLANILSIRNTDTAHAIRVTSVDYYNTKGTLVKSHYTESTTMAPLESAHIFLSNRDKDGGFGANFIVKWEADKEVNVPIIECVMSGNEGQAFVTSGRVIRATEK